jgi:hypothetical protein
VMSSSDTFSMNEPADDGESKSFTCSLKISMYDILIMNSFSTFYTG